MKTKQKKLAKRLRSQLRHSKLWRITTRYSLCLVLLPYTLFLPLQANAQAERGIAVIGGADSGSAVFIGKPSSRTTSADIGTPASESMSGNGSRMGYRISHTNILIETLTIRAGGRLLKLNRDFWVDADSGSLFFTLPVPSHETITIYYRYLKNAPPKTTSAALPGLRLNFGANSSLGFGYSSFSGNGSGIDTSVYGLALNSRIGNGIARLGGLAYFSQTQKSRNQLGPTHLTLEEQKAQTTAKEGIDHLIAQNFDFATGNYQANFSYQDIGKDFVGFQALRQANSKDKSLLDQLNLMEGEKGIKRLGFGFKVAEGKKTPQNGLALQWDQIQDGKGEIVRQSIGYNTAGFRLNYASREVSKDYSLFKGLREADKVQWEKERGLRTTSLGFGMDLHGKKRSVVGGFDFASLRFSDKSGSLERQQIDFRNRGLSFSLYHRDTDKGFARLNDLSDADKTLLALDLYRQYDPNAKAEQVTPVDKVQVAKEAGFTREAFRLDNKVGKTGSLSFAHQKVEQEIGDPKKADTAAVERTAFGYITPTFILNFTRRSTNPKFERLADLSDVEKGYFLLDNHLQYNPAATLAQVSPKERQEFGREAGISRENLRGKWQLGKGGKGGTLSFSQYWIQDDKYKTEANQSAPDVSGTYFDYAGKSLQLNYAAYTASDRFRRFNDLSLGDRAYLGNSYGLTRRKIEGALQVNKTTKVKFGTSRVEGTDDAVQNATAAAIKAKKDPTLAAKAAGSGFERTNLGIETTGLTFSASLANTDREFSRSGDIVLTDPERRLIETERGTTSTDVAFKLTKIKGLAFDAAIYNADDEENQNGRSTHSINLAYALNKTGAISLVSNRDITWVDGKKSGAERSLVNYKQEFQKGYLLTFSQDDTGTFAANKPTGGNVVEVARLETPKNRPTRADLEAKRISFYNGKFENTYQLNLHAKPTKEFAVNYGRTEIDRGVQEVEGSEKVKADPSETTDSFDFQWQATKQFAIVFGGSQTDSSDKFDRDTLSIGLTGEPIKHISLTAKFDEVHHVGKNTKDVADFAISNSKPLRFGPISDLMITARYNSFNDQRKMINETMAGRASWKIWKNDFLLDYGGLLTKTGEETIYRLYSFTTDTNPKNRFHGGFYYKVRTLKDGTEKTIRRFTADWKLAKNTRFTYLYGTMPEDEKGNILPRTMADVALKHQFRTGMEAEVFYRLANDEQTKKMDRSLGLGFDGKVNKYTKLGFGLSVSAFGDAARYDRSNRYYFSFDHQVNVDKFFTVSTEFKSHDHKDLKDEIRATLDFRLVF